MRKPSPGIFDAETNNVFVPEPDRGTSEFKKTGQVFGNSRNGNSSPQKWLKGKVNQLSNLCVFDKRRKIELYR